MLERLRMRPPVKVAPSAGASGIITIYSFANHDQPLRIVIGHGLEQHYIRDAEDRSVRPYAQRQCEDGDESEAGILSQHSRAVTQVLPELFETPKTAGVSIRFLH